MYYSYLYLQIVQSSNKQKNSAPKNNKFLNFTCTHISIKILLQYGFNAFCDKNITNAQKQVRVRMFGRLLYVYAKYCENAWRGFYLYDNAPSYQKEWEYSCAPKILLSSFFRNCWRCDPKKEFWKMLVINLLLKNLKSIIIIRELYFRNFFYGRISIPDI